MFRRIIYSNVQQQSKKRCCALIENKCLAKVVKLHKHTDCFHLMEDYIYQCDSYNVRHMLKHPYYSYDKCELEIFLKIANFKRDQISQQSATMNWDDKDTRWAALWGTTSLISAGTLGWIFLEGAEHAVVYPVVTAAFIGSAAVAIHCMDAASKRAEMWREVDLHSINRIQELLKQKIQKL